MILDLDESCSFIRLLATVYTKYLC